jgi:ribosomal protein S18 acetylase RimI-like enzyme
MSKPAFTVVLLHEVHNRAAFCSDSAPLDRYFQQMVTQDVRRRVAACYVALAPDGSVAGYYTLAAASVLLQDLPPAILKKLPRYPSVPAVRMGRLAVSREFKGQGLGAALLADALARAVKSEIAAYAMLVDAKDKIAADFYRYHGFIALEHMPLTLFLPLATVLGIKS